MQYSTLRLRLHSHLHDFGVQLWLSATWALANDNGQLLHNYRGYNIQVQRLRVYIAVYGNDENWTKVLQENVLKSHISEQMPIEKYGVRLVMWF